MSTPPPSALFTAAHDALRLDANTWIGNYFVFGQPCGDPALEPVNPFSEYRRRFGGNGLRGIWEAAFSSPYKPDDPAFLGVAQSGLCSGFSAVCAVQFDLARARSFPRMAQLALRYREILCDMVAAQLQVLTDDVLRAYKHFVLSPHAASYQAIVTQAGPLRPTLLAQFIPNFSLNLLSIAEDVAEFVTKLPGAHSLVIRGWARMSPTTIRVDVWDPNFPWDDRGWFLLSAEGGFEYRPAHAGACRFTSADVPTVKHANGGFAQLGAMKLAVLPAAMFRPPAKRPFFNGWTVVFG